MNYFVGILLLAMMAGIRADDFEDLFLNDEATEELPDRHPYVQCKIDLYDCVRAGEDKLACLKKYKTCMAQLLPTKVPPYFQCKIDLYDCFMAGNETKLECLKKYKTCVAQLLPTKPPPFLQCKIDLYKCSLAINASKLECLRKYKACIAQLLPTVPPFIKACKEELTKCLGSQSTLLSKAKCFITFGKCIKNKGPGAVVLDAIEDAGQMKDNDGALQCSKDLYNCFKEGKDKKECLKDYRACVAALIPPYMKKCYVDGRQCLDNASGLKEKFKCVKELAMCLKNGSPTQAPSEPSATA